MGQTLCACAGRSDDEPHGLYRGARPTSARKGGRPHLHAFAFKELSGHDSSLLQTQSRTETRELLSDEEREAIRNSVRVIHASGTFHHHVHHGTGVYGYTVPLDDHDHDPATESDEAEYYHRQQQQRGLALTLPARRRPPAMNQVMVDAFRTKLREPIMSPRSKMVVLVGTASDDGSEDGSDDATEHEPLTNTPPLPATSLAITYQDETSSELDLRRLYCESSMWTTDPTTEGNHQDEEEEEEEEEEYFEYARIIVPPGPCGVVFQPPTSPSMPPTIESFVRMYDSTKGPIENSGIVRVGSTLCAINDLEVESMPLSEVIRALNLSAHLEREFVFRK